MLTVRIPVATPDALLTEWGAGALLRLESSPTESGSYTEVATAALLSGLLEYYLVDPAGTSATWYRWRPSIAVAAAPEDFGAYSDPFVAGGPYLTVEQFRALAPSTLDDASLRVLLDAAAQDIDTTAGAPGPIVERLRGRGDLVGLVRPVGTVVSIIEGTTTLAADDYEITPTRAALRRLGDGTNPARYWYRPVITYAPVDDTATRQRIQAELVKLAISFSPGLVSQTIGTWSETYSQPGDTTYDGQRDAILAGLASDVIGF